MTQKLYPFGTIDYVGHNDAANMVDTSLVVANEDGSLLERTEWIIATLAGGEGRLRFQQSISTIAEDKAVVMFSVSLYDFNTGAIPVADIDISGIMQTMKRSRGGGAFDPTGITQPTFAKEDGRVYCSYTFVGAQWEVGDVYKLTLSGIEVDIGGEAVYVPAMVWSNMVQEQVDLHKKVDDIQEDIGDPSARTNLRSLEAMLGNPDVATKTIYETQAVPTENSAADAQVRDVVGKKSDTISGSSIVSLSKVSIANLGTHDAAIKNLHVVPVEDVATDINMRDVVGKKSDTVDGSSLITLAKRTQADLGSFRTRVNLDSLLATLGVPDTAGKDLYTVIVTDRLDSETFGLAAIKEDIGDPSARTNLQSLEEMLGNPDVADKTIYETQAVPVEDSPTDAQIRDVVGKKSDTIAGSSLVSTTKRLEALHPVPAEDVATDVSMRDVIGKKSDTVGGSSLITFAKRTQADLGSFRTRTHLDSLLATLGVPDTAGKDLYTVLTTDRLDSATFGLAAIKAAVDAIDLPAGGIGGMSLASALIDLEQAVGDYDLFTCSVAGVVLEKLIFVNANRDASGDAVFTYFTIQTDAVTPQVVFNSTTGDKTNLTEEAQFSWTGAIYIPVGGKIQLTIAGGPTDSAHECTVIAQYRAVGMGGILG